MLKLWFEATPLQRINTLVGFAILACYTAVANVSSIYQSYNWPVSIAVSVFFMSIASIILETLRLIFNKK